MKALKWIATAVILLFVCSSVLAGSGPTASLTFNVLPITPVNLRTTATQFLWDYDFTQPNSHACSTTLTTGCVNGFIVQTINSANVVIAGPTTIALPTTISTTGLTIGIAAPFTPPATLGSYSVQVTVSWQ
jgi:hypothetical protein